MCAATETKILCPHCGEEAIDDDDLCRFCGRIMVPPTNAVPEKKSAAVAAGALWGKVRPFTDEEHIELFEETTFNLSNPADPIWDD